jgi:hypothetical protein
MTTVPARRCVPAILAMLFGGRCCFGGKGFSTVWDTERCLAMLAFHQLTSNVVWNG